MFFKIVLQEVDVDKISGIIKNSPRVQSVDLKEATPVRSGTPAFGRPEISKIPAAQIALPALEAPASLNHTIEEVASPWKSKDQENAALAAQLTNKFFTKGPVESLMPVPVESLPMINMDRGADMGFRSSLNTSNFNTLPDMGPMIQQPAGYFPRGSFIDRVG